MTVEVWELVIGFNGYAFCRAHSTAYGVEAYQAAWLKRYYPTEFMAGVLSNGKGFYSPLVYVLECHRLGVALLPPTVNHTSAAFEVCEGRIRVPLARMKGLTKRTTDRMLAERTRRPFTSIGDFCERVQPQRDEAEGIIRAGGFDEFGLSRPRQFWTASAALAAPGDQMVTDGFCRRPTPLRGSQARFMNRRCGRSWNGSRNCMGLQSAAIRLICSLRWHGTPTARCLGLARFWGSGCSAAGWWWNSGCTIRSPGRR